jgi:hypothetical protein
MDAVGAIAKTMARFCGLAVLLCSGVIRLGMIAALLPTSLWILIAPVTALARIALLIPTDPERARPGSLLKSG